MQRALTETMGGLILVVDDSQAIRELHRQALSGQFEVVTVASGDEALAYCDTHQPDLILLDIEMPGRDGIETCRQLRKTKTTPVIFATAHESFEEHIRAMDAGGNDIVAKPLNFDLLLRKAALLIRQHRAETRLVQEKEKLQRMAMSFLTTAGENGILLRFMREGISCRSHAALARCLYNCVSDLGVTVIIGLRYKDEYRLVTPRDEASPLEQSMVRQAVALGHVVQFPHHLVVNYPRVCVIARNLPDEAIAAEQLGRIRDEITILAESAEALCEIVDMRIESMARAEQMQTALCSSAQALEELRASYQHMLDDTRSQLENITSKIDNSFAWLETTDAEEKRITAEVDRSVHGILELLAKGGRFDQEFSQVLAALRESSLNREAELFD